MISSFFPGVTDHMSCRNNFNHNFVLVRAFMTAQEGRENQNAASSESGFKRLI